MKPPLIKIGKKGRVVKGESQGTYVLIQDDRENTGGYLILQSPDDSFNTGKGFDDWVESMEDLQRFIDQHNWDISWLD